jgi:hypothetical protein
VYKWKEGGREATSLRKRVIDPKPEILLTNMSTYMEAREQVKHILMLEKGSQLESSLVRREMESRRDRGYELGIPGNGLRIT